MLAVCDVLAERQFREEEEKTGIRSFPVHGLGLDSNGFVMEKNIKEDCKPRGFNFTAALRPPLHSLVVSPCFPRIAGLVSYWAG